MRWFGAGGGAATLLGHCQASHPGGVREQLAPNQRPTAAEWHWGGQPPSSGCTHGLRGVPGRGRGACTAGSPTSPTGGSARGHLHPHTGHGVCNPHGPGGGLLNVGVIKGCLEICRHLLTFCLCLVLWFI